MKLFEVDKLSYYSPDKGYNVKLTEINGNSYFSIIVGNTEAQSIALALEGIETPRPMTHDIILDILSSGDLKVDKIEISNFMKGTFYATLYIKGFHCRLKKIDCRPSYAIAIAIKYCYPIYIKKRVIDRIKPNKIISDSSFNSVEEFESQKEDSLSDIIEKLNYALKNAINKENYEAAAKLRDKIKSYDELR